MQQHKLKLAGEADKEVKPKKDTTASVWNPNWKYRTAGSATDLAEKFRRIRRQQEAEKAAKGEMRRVK
jgi:hypothetical protein